DQLLAHVEAANEVSRHADVVEMLEDVFGDAVVEDALALDHLVLLRIEGGRVVLEVLNQRTGLGALVEDLRLALVDAAAAAHRVVPWLEEIHFGRGFRFGLRGARPGGTTTGAGAICPSASRQPDRSFKGNLSDRRREHNRGRDADPMPHVDANAGR